MTAPADLAGSPVYTVTPGTLQAGDPSMPDYRSPAYYQMYERWFLCRIVRHLNESVKLYPEVILPRYEAEYLRDWETRRRMTFGFEALDDTIHGLTGLAMRDDPVLEDDVPARLKREWETLDAQGTHGAIVVQRALEAALQDGHVGILVDAPPAVEGLTAEQEAVQGVRAYAVLVPIDRISAWEVGTVLGRRVLVMVKIEEFREMRVGTYGTRLVRRFRTLRQQVDGTVPSVQYEVQEEDLTSATGTVANWRLVDEGVLRGPQWIPFHVAHGGESDGADPLRSRPPLMGLTYSNLDHIQIRSDLRYSMHKCAVPVPIFRGRVRAPGEADGGDIVFSSNGGIDTSEQGGADYLEPKGTALSALQTELTNIERRMGSQGYSMLRRDPGSNTTLGEKQMQATREESKLAKAVRSVHDAFEAVLGDFAAFYGLPVGGSITMTREFTDDVLTDAQLKTLTDLEDAGNLTLKTMLLQIQKSTPILEGVDIDAEVQLLEDQAADEPALALPGMVVIPPAPSPAVPAAAPAIAA